MKKRIAVALDDGRYMKTLISEHLGYPHSIAVSPKLGYDVIQLKEEGVMVFNATFHNILVISWQSVLLVEETGENHRPIR